MNNGHESVRITAGAEHAADVPAPTEDEALAKLPPTAEELVFDMSLAVRVAELCHEVNKTYSRSLGERWHEPWADTDQELKDSAIAGVSYLAQTPDASAEDLHARWMTDRQAAGWQHGQTKSVERKEHPNLVAWWRLTPSQQAKDELFLTVVRTVLGQ